MSFEQIITEIRKRKSLFIILPLVVFIMSFAVQYRILQRFKATVSFIVNETDINDLSGPTQFKGDYINSSTASVNRVFRFAYSSEMMDFLIKKYNLYAYYKVDPKEEFAYPILVDRLTNRISLVKTEFDIIEITVADRDRVTTASIANDIVRKLNEINEAYIKSQLKNKIILYDALYQEMKNDVEQQENKMNNLLTNFSVLINTLEKNKVNVDDLRSSLIDLSNSLKNKREEITNMKQLNFALLQALNKEHLETITVIKRALPDYHSNIWIMSLISFITLFVTLCIMVLLVNGYLTYQKQIHWLFKIKT